MKTYYLFLSILILIIISMQACTFAQPAATETPTPAATNTSEPTITPKPTLTPTKTPRPTFTPNVTKTQSYEDIFSQVQKFMDDGLIPSTNGKYRMIEDFTQDVAKIGWLQYWYFDFIVENFVFKAHAEWNTAIDTPDTSGCGIIFAHRQKGQNSDYYGVILDKSRIYFTTIDSGYYYPVGNTRGKGQLNFGNPAAADFTILVYNYAAYVYVDDEFVGEYTLAKSKDLRGNFGYGVISGTNRDYGTHCEISNARMWEITK